MADRREAGMKENVIQEKSYAFALRIVKCAWYVRDEHKEFTLSKQLLRSGTSIGANVEEAIGGQSRKDFTAKLSVAYKEARETHYWLRLLGDAGLMNEVMSKSMLSDCNEILKIIGSILKTTKENS